MVTVVASGNEKVMNPEASCQVDWCVVAAVAATAVTTAVAAAVVVATVLFAGGHAHCHQCCEDQHKESFHFHRIIVLGLINDFNVHDIHSGS